METSIYADKSQPLHIGLVNDREFSFAIASEKNSGIIYKWLENFPHRIQFALITADAVYKLKLTINANTFMRSRISNCTNNALDVYYILYEYVFNGKLIYSIIESMDIFTKSKDDYTLHRERERVAWGWWWELKLQHSIYLEKTSSNTDTTHNFIVCHAKGKPYTFQRCLTLCLNRCIHFSIF